MTRMAEDLGIEGMAEGVDTIACHTFTKEGQPQAMSGLSYRLPSQPFEQDDFRVILTDSRPKLRNSWQKNKQVLNHAEAQ